MQSLKSIADISSTQFVGPFCINSSNLEYVLEEAGIKTADLDAFRSS